jgi:hypothetical protein
MTVMNLKFVPFLSAFLLLGISLGCSDAKTKANEENDSSELSSEALEKKIDLDSIRPIKLLDKTKRATEDWIMHIALNSEVERLKDYKVLDVINNAETIDKVIDSLSITIPEIFETNAVKARLITLKTHSKLLLENAGRNKPNPSEIEELIAKLKLDFNNLNIQLNEVFIIEENPIDFDTNSNE